MTVYFRCKYCGHDFSIYLFDGQETDNIKCPKCRDTDLKQLDKTKKNVFGY